MGVNERILGLLKDAVEGSLRVEMVGFPSCFDCLPSYLNVRR